jgi:hypothetical protein
MKAEGCLQCIAATLTHMQHVFSCFYRQHAVVAQTNLQTSVTNCGACGAACSFSNAAATCSDGSCVMGACNQGYANCNLNNADGCEVSMLRGVTMSAAAAAARIKHQHLQQKPQHCQCAANRSINNVEGSSDRCKAVWPHSPVTPQECKLLPLLLS